jgi:hypothetical protein
LSVLCFGSNFGAFFGAPAPRHSSHRSSNMGVYSCLTPSQYVTVTSVTSEHGSPACQHSVRCGSPAQLELLVASWR